MNEAFWRSFDGSATRGRSPTPQWSSPVTKIFGLPAALPVVARMNWQRASARTPALRTFPGRIGPICLVYPLVPWASESVGRSLSPACFSRALPSAEVLPLGPESCLQADRPVDAYTAGDLASHRDRVGRDSAASILRKSSARFTFPRHFLTSRGRAPHGARLNLLLFQPI